MHRAIDKVEPDQGTVGYCCTGTLPAGMAILCSELQRLQTVRWAILRLQRCTRCARCRKVPYAQKPLIA